MNKTLIATLGLLAQLTITQAQAAELTIQHNFQAGTPARASQVNENFADVEAAVDDNHQRIGTLETGLTAVEADVSTQDARIGALETGLTAVEADVSAQDARIGALETGLTAVEVDVGTLNTGLGVVEADVSAQDARIGALETVPGNFGYANVITVAQSGGDFASVATATASITDSSTSNPYLVRVMPGVYTETDLVLVPPYVHLQGSGPNAAIVTSSRSGASQTGVSATVEIADNSRLSDLTVINDGTANAYSIALYSTLSTRAAVVDNVHAEANGAGGTTGHFAAYWRDAEAIIRNSTLIAGGAAVINAAFGNVNLGGGFPQALIENSTLIGGGNNSLVSCVDSSSTGFGLFLSNASPRVRHSEICGGHRGVSVSFNGNPLIHSSVIKVSSSSSAFLFEISASGSISVANSGMSYFGNKFTGAGTGLRCVHAYNWGTHQPLSDGTTAASACN